MNNMFEILQPYLLEIIAAILTSVAAFIGVKIKKVYEEYVNTKTKKEIVECTVKYVEQVFKELHGEEKLNKAKDKALEWLNEKGIKVSDTELEILISLKVTPNAFANL